MAAGKRLTHTLTPQHLAVLKYLDETIDADNLEYVSEGRIQNNVKFNDKMELSPVDRQKLRRLGEKRPIGEALHDLTYRLNPKDDAFVLVHNSGKHYAISENGRQLARRCSIALRSNPYGEKVPTVIETAKGKPPVLTSVESAAPIKADEEDDDEPVVLPSIREIQGNGPAIVVVGQEEETEPVEETDEVPETIPADLPSAVHDEINSPVPRGSKKPAAPAKTPAKVKSTHRKAAVPGGE